MKVNPVLFFGILAFLLYCQPAAWCGSWNWIPGRQNDVEVSQANSVTDIRTTGPDPQVVGQLSELRPDDCVLEFDYVCPKGVNELQVFIGPPIGKNTSFHASGLPKNENWMSHSCEISGGAKKSLAKNPKLMRIDFGTKPGIQLQIRNVCLRPISAEELQRKKQLAQVRQAKTEEAIQISDYLKASFPMQIDSVGVQSDQIVLIGDPLPKGASFENMRLFEYPPWHSIGGKDVGIPVDFSPQPEGKKWRLTVPRVASGRDRLHSGWRIAYEVNGQAKFISARQFATEIEPVTTDFPRQLIRPKNQKGLGGIERNMPMEELLELGVTAITVNISLSAFIAHRETPDHQRINATGKPVYFNTRGFRAYDPTIQWAHENGIVVTAILLVPSPKKDRSFSPLAHPENDGGVYAMPDLTTERGSSIYACVLDEIAKHYNSTGNSPGIITNWIAHNEIDFHPQWTNMGPQPREIVTETYYRSMRMISNATRRHNPHARVFASCTHHWNMPDDGRWKQLSPRDLLVALQRYSVAEGDFGWGVAYHPYADPLRAATAWEKEKITDDFDSPRITMQNIEVLERFLQHKFMSDSNGKPRPLLLSEQGYHSVSYNDVDQSNQAGSLLYAMKKVRQIPMIESFHYHRWMDHPGEPGTFFGLRTLPTQSNQIGRKKRSWDVYQALGTPREEEVVRDLPQP